MAIQYPSDQISSFQAQDHTQFLTKAHWSKAFYTSGTVDNSPDVNLYMRDDRTSQAIYVPEGTSCVVKWTAIYNIGGTLVAGESEQGTITRASGGNATYTGGAIGSGSGNCTITPTANTTLQLIELVVSDSDSEQDVKVVCYGEFFNLPYYPEAGSTATTSSTALSAVE